jgi:hypothetical protein
MFPTAARPTCARRRTVSLSKTITSALLGVLFLSSLLHAQNSGGQTNPTDPNAGAIRFRLPSVTVTAQKEPEDIQQAPVIVTAVTSETID